METTMTINAKVQQKFEIQHSFPLEALEEQVRSSIIQQFGNELASKVKFNTELTDDAVVVTASLDEMSTPAPKRRTRRSKIEVEPVQPEPANDSLDSPEPEVDLSENKTIAPTEAKNVLAAAGVEVDTDSLPSTKELTKEQYKALKDAMANEKTLDYDKVASVLAFESQHPDLVVEALYGDNPPKPVAHPTATSLSDKVSKEEQEYITYFSWCEKAKGHKVLMPAVNTPVINNVKVASRRYIEVQDNNGNVLKKYVKYPFVAELREVTEANTTVSENTTWE